MHYAIVFFTCQLRIELSVQLSALTALKYNLVEMVYYNKLVLAYIILVHNYIVRGNNFIRKN